MASLDKRATADPVAIGEVLSRLYTSDLQAIVAAAIDILDQRAGDCDLEEDDHSGDLLDIEGEPPSDDGRPISKMLPLYGIDQSRGPINHAEATQAYLAEQAGLVRTSRGTWAHAS